MLPSSFALNQTAKERSHQIVRPDKRKSLASVGGGEQPAAGDAVHAVS
jgi:hypothetical protein